MPLHKAGIVGLGLMGGSIAKALKKYCGVKEIAAYGRNEESLRQALGDGAITGYSTAIDSSFSGCDIIFICTPVDTIADYARMLAPFVGRDCILTDVGSTKTNVYESLAGLDGLCFIGGHPMTGSEKTGYTASVEYLFENAYYLLTPYPDAPPDKVDNLRNIVTQIGAIPVVLPPHTHDHAVAAISHAPHVIASALVNTVRDLDDESHILQSLAAGGFKDITRIASASPEIWQSISMENRCEIIGVLDAFMERLHSFKEQLNNRDNDAVYDFFNNAKTYRDSFQNRTGLMKTYELFVDIVDRPGTIATVTTHLSIHGINIKNIGVVNNREFENGVLQVIFDTESDRNRSIGLLNNLNFTVHVR